MDRSKKQASIKDIAREAGVSISTVSYVINNKKNVSKKTREKVLEIIDKLNYRTNIVARSLRTKSTKAVGIIVPDISTPFTSQVVKGMEEVAKSRGYTLILGCSYYDINEEKRQVNVFLDQLIDGIILFNGFDNSAFVESLAQKIPLVLVDREVGNKGIPSVTVDNMKGMESAVDYLVSASHKKIGYVTFDYKNHTIVKQRYLGYCKGLKKHKIPFNHEYIINTDLFRLKEIDGTYEFMKDYFLRKNNIPTAFAAISDFNAYGIITAAKEAGLKVPEDISVIGYDNITFSQIIDPPLTTIKQPKKLMGQTGMDLMLDIIRKKKLKQKSIVLKTEIIERKSVDKPAKK
jgi:DNA-binding LacI/PurR family transcriptional regulator